MASTYKIAKIFRTSGLLPMAERSIRETMERRPEIYDLTKMQVLMVIDLLNHHYHKGRRDAEAEILAEGYIWDPRQNRLRDLT